MKQGVIVIVIVNLTIPKLSSRGSYSHRTVVCDKAGVGPSTLAQPLVNKRPFFGIGHLFYVLHGLSIFQL